MPPTKYPKSKFPIFFQSQLGLPDGRYFTANFAEAGKRPVFYKPVPEASILKVNNFQ